MNYIIRIFLAVVIYHFTVCTVSSFVSWESMYFNVDEWDRAPRFFYILALMIVAAIVASVTYEENTKTRT